MSLLTQVMIAPTVRDASCNNSHVADLGDRLAGTAEAMLYLEPGVLEARSSSTWPTPRREVGTRCCSAHGPPGVNAAASSTSLTFDQYRGTAPSPRSISLSCGRSLCIGDQVVARHGDRSIHPVADRNGWMRNGTTGQIVDIRATDNTPLCDEIDIATAAGIITCMRPTFDRPDSGIDLAYALTSYGVQGATHDVSTSAIAPSPVD